ncbi:MAG TPA: hypothetical protein VNL98_04600, partial [Gemmatimonadales bacterium]|nr:hypothetical protein [Gemmatimonadales bacterium]
MLEPTTQPSEQLFELAPEEIVVCLRVRGASGRYELTHRLRPPALEDWRAYERDLRSTVEIDANEPEALRFSAATLEAAGALYDRLFRSAAGYRAGESGVLTAEQVPLHHKEMVVRALSDVAPAAAEEADAPPELFALEGGRVEVVLAATRNGAAHPRLAHLFRAPSAADRVEYSRVTSQALYVRNSGTLKTLLPSRLPGLVALYDRLIEDVRGYAAAGAPLADRAAIVRHMDPLH